MQSIAAVESASYLGDLIFSVWTRNEKNATLFLPLILTPSPYPPAIANIGIAYPTQREEKLSDSDREGRWPSCCFILLGYVGMGGRSYSNKYNEQRGLLLYAFSTSLEPRCREEIKYNLISFLGVVAGDVLIHFIDCCKRMIDMKIMSQQKISTVTLFCNVSTHRCQPCRIFPLFCNKCCYTQRPAAPNTHNNSPLQQFVATKLSFHFVTHMLLLQLSPFWFQRESGAEIVCE